MKLLPNGIAVLENDTHISKWVEEHGRLDFDRWMLAILEEYIKPGDWVVDAGAFIGDHTLAYARKVGQEGCVMAFEPNPAAFECLVWNMDALAQREGISVLPRMQGLSDEYGKLNIALSDNAGASHITPERSIPNTVEVIDLDSLNLERLNFLKMDIEGYEHKALRGAKKTILKHRPAIFLEINKTALERNGSSFSEVAAYLGSLFHYRLARIMQPEVQNPLIEPQFDVLFLPR